MSRPVEYTEARKAKILKALEAYMEAEDIPIVSEFAYKNGIRRQRLYELFPDAIKGMIEKKESALERMSLNGDINTTQAIFSLKQLGWSDKQETTLKTLDDDGKETGFKFVPGPNAST